jgi:hypothetical protein
VLTRDTIQSDEESGASAETSAERVVEIASTGSSYR